VQVRPVLESSTLTLYEEGRSAQNARRFADAAAPWTAAIKQLLESGQADAAAWLYLRLGQVLEAQRMWKDGAAAYSAASELLVKSADVAAQSRAFTGLAKCAQGANDFQSALRWFELAVQTNTAGRFESWIADRLIDIGILHNNRDSARTQDYFERALVLRERLKPDSIDVSNTLHNLGIVAFQRGELAAAEDYYSRSIAIKERRGGNPLDLAGSFKNLSNVLQARGDLAAAHDYTSRAMAIEERLEPNSLRVAASLHNFGNIATDRGNLKEAETFYNRALAIRQKLTPDSLDVAGVLANLGVVAKNRGDLEAALDFQTRGLAIRQRLAPDSLSVASSFMLLGNIARTRGELSSAQDYLVRALAIYQRQSPNSLNVAGNLNNLGMVAVERKDPAEAKGYFERALALKDKLAPDTLTVADTLDNIGDLFFDQGDLTNALESYKRVFAIRERLAPNSLSMAATLNSLAGIAHRQERFTDAVSLLMRAVDIVESQRWQIVSADRRALLMSLHTGTYSSLVRAYMALGQVPEAFAVAEQAKARSMFESLSEASVDIRRGVDTALLERERLLRQQLNGKANRQIQVLSGKHSNEQAAAAAKELDSAILQYRELQSQIRITSPEYAALTQPQSLDPKQIQNELLDAGTVLLEYALGDELSHVFVVSKDSIKAFALPNRATIEPAARRFYGLITARQPVAGETLIQRRLRIEKADAELQTAGAELSDLVLKPLRGLISNKRLLIVAEGTLQYVPFGALPLNGRPLVLEHEIVSLPSASVLSTLRRDPKRRPQAQKTIAVVADPVFDSSDPRLQRTAMMALPAAERTYASEDEARALRASGILSGVGAISRLPFTRDEANVIVSLVPPGQSIKALDFRASRATAAGNDLGNYRIVHLASHGLLNTDHPELSGIVLSLVDEQGKSQEGLLRLHEVYNLNWSAELVVLSACQTALGNDVKGEGLVGLTRGFMYGGAKSVVASLWNINDGATAEFMKHFYQGLLSREIPASAALRAAQVEMLKKKQWTSPYYWAAFVIQGDWK
jgi:CHAT domain-containing protein/tetratricopeptide (TPR) repeat protein